MERRILVAEDSATQRERLRLLLEDEGYRVELAKDGREGLESVSAAPPDLIISDVVMPEMDGYAFCQALKASEQTRKIPFVLFTERHTPMDIIEGFLRGADNFIPKASSDEYLLQRVGRILDQLERRRDNRLTVEIIVRVGGRDIPISADKQQIFELLVSSVEEAGRTGDQLREAQQLLEQRAQDLERHVEERTRELSLAENKYRTLVEQIPAVIYVAAPDQVGRTLYISPQIDALLGFSAAEFEADPGLWPRQLHPEDRERVLGEFAQIRKTGEPTSSEYRLLARDGRIVWVRDEARLIPDGIFVQGILVDITDRKRTELALQKSEEQLLQAQKMESVGRLAGGVAHDFNNLLNIITGYAGLLSKRLPEGDRLRRYADDILKTADRAADLTRQLLAFSRKQVIEPRVLDLNVVVADMERLLRRLIGEDIELATALAPGLGRVKADPSQLEQVILNLAINARDAMPLGGRLTIETANVQLDEAYSREHVEAPPGPYVMLAVSDTGEGMTPEVKARVFEPFFTTKEKGKGTGLGLATVHGIVKQSGGSIWVYSELGRGATFKAYLPRVDEAPREAAAQAAATETPRGSETILLVEDEEALREIVRECLEGAGYTVIEARHGGEALQIGEKHPGPIHLLVTDVVMPGVGGRELAEQLGPLRREMRVLYLSGYTDDAVVRHGVLAEDVAFLQKPFTVETLTRKIREVLDR